jgi:hypothetical protein
MWCLLFASQPTNLTASQPAWQATSQVVFWFLLVVVGGGRLLLVVFAL